MSLISDIFTYCKRSLGLYVEVAKLDEQALSKKTQEKILKTADPFLVAGAKALEKMSFTQEDSALGVIDVQIDFCNNFGGTQGSLAVNGSDEVVNPINRVIAYFQNCF